MKSVEDHDLQETERPLAKTIRRIVRKPRKTAPKPEVLRGWANSAIKTRSKS